MTSVIYSELHPYCFATAQTVFVFKDVVRLKLKETGQ